MNELLLLLLIFLVALCYSSIGHGGASGYLAIMSLFNVLPHHTRVSALLLNLFVSIIAFFYYYKRGFFRSKLFFSFAIGSVPAAYLGGTFSIDIILYKLILAIFLILASARILYKISESCEDTKRLPLVTGIIIGVLLGFLSGVIGIGGGIILSPLLVIFQWAKLKEAAAVSSLFIFVNSVSGLAGVFINEINIPPQIFYWMLASIMGALAGSYLGSSVLNIQKLRYVLTAILFIAGVRLLFELK